LDVGQGGATEGETGDEDFIHWGVFRGKGVMECGGGDHARISRTISP
jgi:hypothetical protein